jgi:hypothetical protein
MLMLWKLPMPAAGTIPQSDPNRAVSAMGWCDAMARWEWLAEVAGAAEGVLPQAAAVKARRPVMVPPVMADLAVLLLVRLIRMDSPALG